MMKRLWDRLMCREVISYLIFGVLTTLVNWVAYWGMTKSGIDYRVSTVGAWAVSVLFAFAVNKIYVFQSRSWKFQLAVRELAAFVACRVVSGVMEFGFMILLVSGLHMDEYISKIPVSVMVVVVNYVFSKLFIFRKKEEKSL